MQPSTGWAYRAFASGARLPAMRFIAASVPVPAVDQRGRVPAEAIEEVVRHIAAAFPPDRIVLFGSYAYGQPDPESDVDLMVVMDTDLRETAQAMCTLQQVEHHFGLDVIVRTPSSLARRVALGDPFMIEVLDRGKVMYERSPRLHFLFPSAQSKLRI